MCGTRLFTPAVLFSWLEQSRGGKMWKLNEKDIPGMKHCRRILLNNELIKKQIKRNAAFTVRF